MIVKTKVWLDLLILFTSIGIMISVLGCKRSSKDLDFLGPMEYKSASPNFVVYNSEFSASSNILEFENGSINFTSSFSEEVTWKIKITGLLSGAVKELIGTSSTINSTNSIWDGSATNIYFFRRNEVCVAELSFFGSSIVLTDTLRINNTKRYDGVTYHGIRYTKIDDFDGNGVPMASASKDAFDASVTMGTDTLKKVQGLSSFKMAGIDLNNNSWSGGLNHTNLIELKTAAKSPQVTDPDSLYINVYVFGTGKANSGIQIKMYEVDDAANFANTGSGYIYNQLQNDGWTLDVPVNWTGWKLVSVKFSSFKPASDPTLGGGGNRIKQPNQITGMGISLLSLPNSGGDTGVQIDFVTLTEGGPFIP